MVVSEFFVTGCQAIGARRILIHACCPRCVQFRFLVMPGWKTIPAMLVPRTFLTLVSDCARNVKRAGRETTKSIPQPLAGMRKTSATQGKCSRHAFRFFIVPAFGIIERCGCHARLFPITSCKRRALLFTTDSRACKLRNGRCCSRKRTNYRMPNDDFKNGPEPDPLSATGMFCLRSFEAGSTPAQGAPDLSPGPSPDPWKSTAAPASGPAVTRAEWPAEQVLPTPPTASHAPAPGSGPGEFTQMFQALNRPNPEPVAPQASAPAMAQPLAAAPSASSVPSTQGPGEFTRIFVAGAVIEHGNKTLVETPQFTPPAASTPSPASTPAPAAPASPVPASSAPPAVERGFLRRGFRIRRRLRGSFTQFFKAQPPSPSAHVAPPVQHVSAPPPPRPVAEKPWQPEFSAPPKAAEPAAGPSVEPSSATGMLSSFAAPAQPASSAPSSSGFTASPYQAAPRAPEPAPYRSEPMPPMPSYTPAPAPPEPSGMEAGSVTKLIQRLSQVPREAPPEPTHATAAFPPAPPVSSGPGEFTRMISGDTVKAALAGSPAAPPPPAAAPAPPPAFAMPAMPAAPKPAVPVMAPPPMPAMPAAPKAAAPAPAPMPMPAMPTAPKVAPPPASALAAPKGKLEAMVPILLVFNTFLLVVLLVVVIFAMKK